MTNLQQRNQARLNRAMAGENSDQRPFHLFVSYPFVNSATGVNLKDYFENPQLMYETQLELHEKLEGCFSLYPDYALLPECHGLGAELIFDENGFPSTGHLKINDIDDVKKLKPANPYDGSYMTNALKALEYMKKHAPSSCDVTGTMLVGPVTVASMLRGITDFCTDLYIQPDMVQAMLDIILETQINYLKAQEKILGKLNRILIADDISSFLNLELYERFVKPCYNKIYKEFPQAEKWLHNDAEAKHLPAAIEGCGFDIWHVGYCVDMIEARKNMQGKTCLFGNLIPIDQLMKKTPKEVTTITNSLLEKFGNDPKFVLSTGGFISHGTPIENILAMMYAVDQYK